MERVYADLRRLAAAYLRNERRVQTLQPTAVVNEVYLRLFGGRTVRAENRLQFMALAGAAMRHFIIDYARRQSAGKRPNPKFRVELDDRLLSDSESPVDILAVDSALRRLEEMDPRQCRIVEMRFFAGFTEEEIAESLGISSKTVKRDWKIAKLWLRDKLGK